AEVTPELIEDIILESADKDTELVPYFQEGRSLNFMSLAEKLRSDYDLGNVTLPEPEGPMLDAGILEESKQGSLVLVKGFVCDSRLEPPGSILVSTGGRMAPLQVRWENNFVWQGECLPGNIIQHVFSAEYRGAQRATYHLQAEAGTLRPIPRDISH